jgi:segregation and condensation protein A
MLAEIKSRMLLPRSSVGEEDGEDPRAALVRRLQEYERYRKAAEDINELPRVGRDLHLAWVSSKRKPVTANPPQVSLDELLLAFSTVMTRAALNKHHHIQLESLSMRERMTEILSRVESEKFLDFESLFKVDEGRRGLVVTFIAILELLKESLIVIVQQEPFAPIHVKAAA